MHACVHAHILHVCMSVNASFLLYWILRPRQHQCRQSRMCWRRTYYQKHQPASATLLSCSSPDIGAHHENASSLYVLAFPCLHILLASPGGPFSHDTCLHIVLACMLAVLIHTTTVIPLQAASLMMSRCIHVSTSCHHHEQ
jgi:hypothetical protein